MINKKHQLKNDLLSFLEEKELMWPEKEVSDVGEVFVQSLMDLLWYIDNHHSTFNERSLLYLTDLLIVICHRCINIENILLKTCHLSCLLTTPTSSSDACNHATGREAYGGISRQI